MDKIPVRFQPYLSLIAPLLLFAVAWTAIFIFRGWRSLQEFLTFFGGVGVLLTLSAGVVLTIAIFLYKERATLPWVSVNLINLGKGILVECTRLAGSKEAQVYLYIWRIRNTIPEITQSYRTQPNQLPSSPTIPVALELIQSAGQTNYRDGDHHERLGELRLQRPYGQSDPVVRLNTQIEIEFEVLTEPRLRRRLYYRLQVILSEPEGSGDPKFTEQKLTRL